MTVGPNETSPVSPPARLQVRAPHFPFAYTPHVERMGAHIYDYTSSMFLWPDSERNGLGSGVKMPRSELQMKRDSLDVVDEQLRISFLEIQVLKKSLQKAEGTRTRLEEERKRKWDEFQSLRQSSNRNMRLPLEIVQEIEFWCFSTSDHDVLLTGDSDDELAWGDVLYKGIQFSLSVEEIRDRELDEVRLSKACNCVLDIDIKYEDDGYIEDISRVLEETHYQLNKPLEVNIETAPGRLGRDRYLRALSNCKAVFPSMTKLVIYNWGRGGNHFDAGGHVCLGPRGCTGDLDAPRLREADIPLEYIPCFHQLFKRIQYLSVNLLPPVHGTHFRFSDHFRNIDLSHLVTFSLSGVYSVHICDDLSWFSSGPPVVIPNLKRLSIGFAETSTLFVISLLNCINATQLRTLEICGLFWFPRAGESLVAEVKGLPEMLEFLNARCGGIYQLSFDPPNSFDYSQLQYHT